MLVVMHLKVFRVAYCQHFSDADYQICKGICEDFVETIGTHFSDFTKKAKIHILLHFVDCMKDFGPTSSFNTERLPFCCSYSYVRSYVYIT